MRRALLAPAPDPHSAAKTTTLTTTTTSGGGAKPFPCHAHLLSYEGCVEAHRGQAPRPYEAEWCEEERQSYLNCRKEVVRKGK